MKSVSAKAIVGSAIGLTIVLLLQLDVDGLLDQLAGRVQINTELEAASISSDSAWPIQIAAQRRDWRGTWHDVVLRAGQLDFTLHPLDDATGRSVRLQDGCIAFTDSGIYAAKISGQFLPDAKYRWTGEGIGDSWTQVFNVKSAQAAEAAQGGADGGADDDWIRIDPATLTVAERRHVETLRQHQMAADGLGNVSTHHAEEVITIGDATYIGALREWTRRGIRQRGGGMWRLDADGTTEIQPPFPGMVDPLMTSWQGRWIVAENQNQGNNSRSLHLFAYLAATQKWSPLLDLPSSIDILHGLGVWQGQLAVLAETSGDASQAEQWQLMTLDPHANDGRGQWSVTRRLKPVLGVDQVLWLENSLLLVGYPVTSGARLVRVWDGTTGLTYTHSLTRPVLNSVVTLVDGIVFQVAQDPNRQFDGIYIWQAEVPDRPVAPTM